MPKRRLRLPPTEIIHRNLIIDEIDEAMETHDKKYVKTLLPLIQPLHFESDMEDSVLSTAPPPTIWDCCCCFVR